MADSLSSIDGVLKRHYLDMVEDMLNNQKKMWARFEKTSDGVQAFGSGFATYIPTILGHNEAGIASRGEGGTLPTAGALTTSQGVVPLTYLYGSLELSGQSIDASRRTEGAIQRAVTLQMESMAKRFGVEFDRQIQGRGFGALAKITAASATPQTANVLFAVDDASRLAEGMIVDMWSTNAASGGAQTAGTPTISRVDIINNQIAFAANQNITQNDFIYRTGARGLTAMGIEGAIDGADSAGAQFYTTFQSIARNVSFIYQAGVIDNGGAVIDLDLISIQRLLDVVAKLSGEDVSALWSDIDLQNSYVALLAADKRYVNTLELDGGWKTIEYTSGGGAIPWFANRQTLKQRLFAVNEDSFGIYLGQDKATGWVKTPQEGVLQRRGTTDAYFGTMRSYWNLGCKRPNANGVLRDRR